MLHFARIVHEKFGIEPPSIIQQEIEIEKLRKDRAARRQEEEAKRERLEKERRKEQKKKRQATLKKLELTGERFSFSDLYDPYDVVKSDPIDVAVGALCDAFKMGNAPLRLSQGEYIIGREHAYVRIIRDVPLAYVEGEGWVDLASLMEKEILAEVSSPRSIGSPSPRNRGSVAVMNGAAGVGGVAHIQQVEREERENKKEDEDNEEEGDNEEEEEEEEKERERREREEVGDHVGPLPSAESGSLVDPPEEFTTIAGEGEGVKRRVGPPLVSFASDVAVFDEAVDSEEALRVRERESVLPLIEGVVSPLDVRSKQLGRRWYESSGAKLKRERSKRDYPSYLSDTSLSLSPNYEQEMDQIRKDIDEGRTSSAGFSDEITRSFLSQLEQAEPNLTQKIKNICVAWVHRCPEIGYVQGMNEVSLLLLAFLDEEEAFWTLCAMNEDLHAKDFFSREAPMMNGFQSLSHVFGELAEEKFTALSRSLPPGQSLSSLSRMAAMKWWIDLYSDGLSLSPMLVVWDEFLTSPLLADEPLVGGDTALLRSALALLELTSPSLSLSNSENRDEVYPALIEAARQVTAEELYTAMRPFDKWFSADELLERERKAREEIRGSWAKFKNQFLLLAQSTLLSSDEVTLLLSLLRDKDGLSLSISKDEFSLLLSEADIHLRPDALRWLWSIYSDEDGNVPWKSLLVCLSVLSDGSNEERLLLCWKVFDEENSGSLSSDQASQLSHSLTSMINSGHRSHQGGEEGEGKEKESNSDCEDVVEFDTAFGLKQGGSPSFEMFKTWVVSQPQLLECLALPASRRAAGLLEYKQKVRVKKARGCCASISSQEDEYYEVWEDEVPPEEETVCIVM